MSIQNSEDEMNNWNRKELLCRLQIHGATLHAGDDPRITCTTEQAALAILDVTGVDVEWEPRQQAQVPDLQSIEQYRMQMAGISAAALGYWKEGDGIHPDYDTVALRDVAKLYAKYDALFNPRK